MNLKQSLNLFRHSEGLIIIRSEVKETEPNNPTNCSTEKRRAEHLEIMTSDSLDVSKRCTSYGAVFIGTISAEVLGDYGAGPDRKSVV